VLVSIAVASAAACGSAAPRGTCQELREAEDQRSGMHVLEAGTTEYLTDPPTSGPHSNGPTPSGALTQPVAPEIQVRLLEAGGAMIVYPPNLDRETVDLLATLTSDLVVSAPSPSPATSIVATAWTWKLVCTELDVERLRTFLSDRRDAAPGLD
jgi:hypothetical protein